MLNILLVPILCHFLNLFSELSLSSQLQMLRAADPKTEMEAGFLNVFIELACTVLNVFKSKWKEFSYSGPSVWNSLPVHFIKATSIDTSKPTSKTCFISKNLVSVCLLDLLCVCVHYVHACMCDDCVFGCVCVCMMTVCGCACVMIVCEWEMGRGVEVRE